MNATSFGLTNHSTNITQSVTAIPTTKTTFIINITSSTSIVANLTSTTPTAFNHTTDIPEESKTLQYWQDKFKENSSSWESKAQILYKNDDMETTDKPLLFTIKPIGKNSSAIPIQPSTAPLTVHKTILNHSSNDINFNEDGMEEIGVTGVTYKEVVIETRSEQEAMHASSPSTDVSSEFMKVNEFYF
jgi:hypothetical protein